MTKRRPTAKIRIVRHMMRGKTTILTAAAVLVLAGIVLSPLALQPLLSMSSSWDQISDVGQSYGGLSAILSAIALVTVGLSFQQQVKQNRLTKENNTEINHRELVMMSWDDPELDEVWGSPVKATERTSRKQLSYANMIVAHYEARWLNGAIAANQVRIIARNMFSGPAGIDFWRQAGERRLDAVKEDKLSSQFYCLIDEEYKNARSADRPSRADASEPKQLDAE